MGDKKIESLLLSTGKRLQEQIEQKKVIFIISNSTVDAIASSSILFDSINRNGGSAIIRCLDSSNYLSLLESMKCLIKEKHGSYVFLDFDSNVFVDIIDSITQESYFLFINSDKNLEDQENTNENENFSYININKLNMNLDFKVITTISAAVYYLIKPFDSKITQKSYLPVVAEISKFSKINKNKLDEASEEILRTAITLNLIERKKSLIFVDRQTSSIIDALENNTSNFIRGLTWNKRASIEVLKESGISITEKKRIKSLDEFEDKDYDEIVKAIEKFVEKGSLQDIQDSKGTITNRNIRDKLLAYGYILTNEESNSILKEAHSFSRVLESCIKRRKFGIAVAISLGDRYDLLNEVQNQLQEEKSKIKKVGTKIFAEKWRLYVDKEIVFINGEGVIDEEEIDQFANMIGSSISFSDKIICLRTTGTENMEVYKYTLINGDAHKLDSVMMRNKINEFIKSQDLSTKDRFKLRYLPNNGDGNIEIIVPVNESEVFLSNIKKIVVNARIA
ncbi:MAG TPA: hypothetical protein VJR94_03515 [Candidatus Nitrosocosmicus sp.]|jgi:hypothetical protein|nr:hypothetical protein [Candidatus Nitrosocosmicus sp.]